MLSEIAALFATLMGVGDCPDAFMPVDTNMGLSVPPFVYVEPEVPGGVWGPAMVPGLKLADVKRIIWNKGATNVGKARVSMEWKR